MDEQEQEPDEKYVKGFNNGYLLAKHDPSLAAQIAVHPNQDNTYFNGLIGGKTQYEDEVREWSKSFSRGGASKDDRDLNQER